MGVQVCGAWRWKAGVGAADSRRQQQPQALAAEQATTTRYIPQCCLHYNYNAPVQLTYANSGSDVSRSEVD